MKRLSSSIYFSLIAAMLAVSVGAAGAVTFTNDTTIGFSNTNYDGLDILVTNCTLTVDGAHTFAGLQVLKGANVTHSYAPGGVVYDGRSITNEQQVLSTTNVAMLSNAHVVDSSIVVQDLAGLVTFTNEVDYVVGFDTNGLTTLLLTTNSAIAEGSTDLVSYDTLDAQLATGVSLTVTGDMTVAQGGMINADGRGYGGGTGAGKGATGGNPASGSGAGHGGYGGQSAGLAGLEGRGLAYDSIQQPALLGSGGGNGYGGPGGAGGGCIKLVVGGSARVDGSMSANGANGMKERSGGGSGGSIWLSAQNFTGTGQLTANGGMGEPSQGGGGGGGRISVQYAVNLFAGSISAFGGDGFVRGGAGTLYTRASNQSTGLVLADNGGQAGETTPLITPETVDLTAQGGAIISQSETHPLGNVLVTSNAWISVSGKPLLLTVTGNATIENGGGIIGDGAGYASGQGPGAGKSDTYAYTGGGGGYGGFGAMGGSSPSSQYAPTAYGGTPYGLLTTPTEIGSGGGSTATRSGGGAGGGAIHVSVAGTLVLNGRISADGNPGFGEGGGGGSGGSVWLTVGTLAGGGTISANGGQGNGFGATGGGGGGGGRIAIQYGLYVFFGTTTARGGGGSAWGGAGTIYTKANSQSWGQVLAENGGQAGTNTSWIAAGTIDLTVKGGAIVVPPIAQTIGTLLIASNGWLRITNQVLTVSGNATVQGGGGINADGGGYGSSTGPGAGKYINGTSGYIGGGGGYGGYGAAGSPAPYPSTSVPFGGTAYGSLNTPLDLGSGGGGYSGIVAGGAGGGAIRLTVTGVLQVDGRMSAEGGAGVNSSGGGGSGGAIFLTVGTLTGRGTISADGGMGNNLGGGGGGGRIAIVYGGYDFSGAVSAHGGGGYATGGAGTIYTKSSDQSSYGTVVLDNGGKAATNTTLGTSSVGTIDLTLRNGAVFSPTAGQSIHTLLIASNSWMRVTNQILTVTGNATVQGGGGIIADSAGYAGGSGPGAGRYASGTSGYIGGGGGYGGYGGLAAAAAGYVAAGGNAYGGVKAPIDAGSGGGGYSSIAVGGPGGGVVRLNVTGVLRVDGTISANGGAGSISSGGGGSGGTISLIVGTLSGAGVVSVNGGMGKLLGGGGSGGRIAILYDGYDFSGIVSAYGGGGYATGGAGTIYLRGSNQLLPGQVVVDNGGQAGTNTTLGLVAPGLIDLTVKNGGVVSPPSSQEIGTLLVASNGWVSVVNQTLTVTGNATIQPGGGIIADGTGSPAGQGQGAGRYEIEDPGYVGGGGGYGGYGATGGDTPYAYGGTPYGSVTAPTALGSGGAGPTTTPGAAGGAGGGAIRLTVTGTLEVGGRISALGLAGAGPSAGGGSGGSIYLTVGTLAGPGVISANGGAGNYFGGGGGGGRIAISYSAANSFSGVMSAYGGGGYAAGGAGTIYIPTVSSPTGGHGLVLVDNGGQSGTNTSWMGLFSGNDLTVEGGAVVAPAGSQSVGNLVVGNKGQIFLSSIQGAVPTLTVTGDAIIQTGGGITADGTGYAAGSGQGAGKYVSTSSGYVSGGGGYGGNGGSSGGNTAAAGGNNYGGVTQPALAGSGGGRYSSTLYGGAGGGGVRLNVSGTLRVDGVISAAGGASTSPNFGGGSGGSVWLTAGTLAGAGVISANGGAGYGLGGGGGGGRVALQSSVSAFSGVVSAYGGSGYVWGGAGTIYTKANNQPWGQLVVDNGGQGGTNTSWSGSGTIDLTVKGGAVVTPPTGQTYGNLMVESNGWISTSGNPETIPQLLLTVSSNATIEAGGGIIADGAGYPGGQGPGAGRFSYSTPLGYVGGGGGHGGLGAASGGTPAGQGGTAYGSVTSPSERGSGGGASQGSLAGGAGGGSIRMTVTGSLLNNGRVSADGGGGVAQGSGGGSGGSIWLTAGTLAGNGIIAANGGAGNGLGGGGGGGCVSLQYGLNRFGGGVSACGGGGFAWGGAGTIYTKANSAAIGRILIDNGGNSGTNTPLPYLSPFDLTIRGGATAYPSGPYLILSNLLVDAGGTFTCTKTLTNLDVTILHDAMIDDNGAVTVDGNGFAAGAGSGAGLSTNSIGSGAGYGGNGGASIMSPGGSAYGSVQQPVDRGSGGGLGSGQSAGGSEGGGAIRFTVGGALTVNGLLSADGNDALQDNSGGGSGGSIWLAAFALAGTGLIAADGGAGELYQGGGGGGGRIAIYAPVNVFAGLVLAAGAAGASPGQTGSVFYAAALAVPQVASMTPVGTITAAVSSIEIAFSTPVNPYSVVAPNVGLTAPGGVAVDNLTATALSPYRFQITLPVQTARGDYTLTVGPQVEGLSGQPMSQAYMGTFSIVWPMVQGAVTDTIGLPVPGVLLQPDGGIAATTTDTNGNYVLSLPPGGTINVLPSKAGLMFVPGSRSYTDVAASILNENYLAVDTVAPALTTQVQTNTYVLSWYGITGVTYQPFYSPNLEDWLPYGVPLTGTNGALQLLVPIGTDPNMFFRVGVSY